MVRLYCRSANWRSLLRLIIHDWSKFLPCEWIPYANYFYGDLPDWDHAKVFSPGYPYSGTKQGAAEAFDCAWLRKSERRASQGGRVACAKLLNYGLR
jgi:hypothetical protein